MSRNSKARCNRCFVHLELCFCEKIPVLELSTELHLIIHAEEMGRPSNSGQLALSILKNSQMHVRGRPGEPIAYDSLLSPEHTNLLLYPHETAKFLGEEFLAQHPGPYRLLVPDGTWGQGTRTARRLMQANGEKLIPVKLPLGPPTTYRLRKETNEYAMSTFEAIARSLSLLEKSDIGPKMQQVFDEFVNRMLFMRGQAPKPPQGQIHD